MRESLICPLRYKYFRLPPYFLLLFPSPSSTNAIEESEVLHPFLPTFLLVRSSRPLFYTFTFSFSLTSSSAQVFGFRQPSCLKFSSLSSDTLSLTRITSSKSFDMSWVQTTPTSKPFKRLNRRYRRNRQYWQDRQDRLS